MNDTEEEDTEMPHIHEIFDKKVFLLSDILSCNSKYKPPVEIPDPKDTFSLFYTSGTSGKPKGKLI
jgi:long-subunit acyl-CoA synthetase (AMP-forming)